MRTIGEVFVGAGDSPIRFGWYTGLAAAGIYAWLKVHAASLLEEAVHVPAGASRLNQDRLENTLQDMAQFSHKIPALPDEAFARESLYSDHD